MNPADLTPDDLHNLLWREKRWLELFLTARHAGKKLRTADARFIASATAVKIAELLHALLRN